MKSRMLNRSRVLTGGLLALVLSLSSLGMAQTMTAKEAHSQAKTLAVQADALYEPDFFDQRVWNQAARLAEQAVDAEPNNTEYLRTLGEIYTKTQFWWQAYRVWTRLEELGALDSQARSRAALSAAKIGYIRMQLGLISEAAPFLETSLRWQDRSEIRALLAEVRRQIAVASN